MSVSAGTAEEMPRVRPAILYRAHIDGLRGLSIIAMIFFHAKFFADTGGFIGVDIFFVISGFLITSIIVRDLNAGTFSLVKFWERRIRRIIPPLFVVMTAVAIAGYFLILYPQDYHHLGNAIIAQSGFVSNILFALTDNYFDQSAQYSPLLHTWTLSLEEQFYLIFPFVILLCVYLSRKWFKKHQLRVSWQAVTLMVVSALGIASFLLNIWFINVAPSSGLQLPFVPAGVFWQTSLATAGFYLLPMRAWEIAIGIVLALSAFKIHSKILAEVTSVGGLLLIVGAIFFLHETTPYPGIAALLPTLGTFMIIAANEAHHTKVGALLSLRPLIGIGLISYSLYLWYWPLFVFTGILTLFSPTPLEYVAAIALALVLAVLTYRFVETPIRKKQLFTTTKKAYLFGIGSMVLMALGGLFIQETSLMHSSRIPASAQALLTVANETGGTQETTYFPLTGDAQSYSYLEGIGDRSAHEPTFVLWGDSQADALAPLFDALGKSAGVQGAVFFGGACAPIPGVHQSPPATGCEDVKAQALSYIESHDIGLIFLVARWSYYVMGGPDGARVGFITDSSQISTTPQEAQAAFERNFVPLVEKLAGEGRSVYIVKQAPEQVNFDTHEAFYAAVLGGSGTTIQPVSAGTDSAYQSRANAVIDGLATIPGVHIIDPSTVFCTQGGICELEKGEVFLYRDEDHVSAAGAFALEPLFTQAFERIGTTR